MTVTTARANVQDRQSAQWAKCYEPDATHNDTVQSVLGGKYMVPESTAKITMPKAPWE